MTSRRTRRVTVVDYGGSNFLSVVRALRHCGAEVLPADTPAAIKSSDRLVLPGVGAFGDVQRSLSARDLVSPIRDYAAAGRPFLGICVGMQLMMDYSEEFGKHPGMGLIPGGVKPVPAFGADGTSHRIPHIGWEEIAAPKNGGSWAGTVLEAVRPGNSLYFVHSFAAEPDNESDCLATCDYDGIPVSAVIGRGAVVGCQFHPEKSGPVGLRILRRFMDMGDDGGRP